MSISSQSKNLIVYNSDASKYLHVSEHATESERFNIVIKDTSNNAVSTTMTPHFECGLSYGSTAMDVGDGIASNAADIAAEITNRMGAD